MVNSRYHPVAITLHWLTAAAILALIVMGLVMTEAKPGSHLQFALYQLHKSVGVTVLLLTVLRLGWRLSHTAPALPEHMPGWEKFLAHAGHAALYGFLLLMPLEGWALVSASVFNIPTVLFGLVPLPHLPWLAELSYADKKPVEDLLKALHEAAAWVMIVTILGHAAAALRHHVLLRDDVLTCMLPRWRKDQ